MVFTSIDVKAKMLRSRTGYYIEQLSKQITEITEKKDES